MLRKINPKKLSNGQLFPFFPCRGEGFLGGYAHGLEVEIEQGLFAVPYGRMLLAGNNPPRF